MSISDNARKLHNLRDNFFEEVVDPGSSDDILAFVQVGSLWFNKDTGNLFICSDNTEDNAVWDIVTGVQETPEPILDHPSEVDEGQHFEITITNYNSDSIYKVYVNSCEYKIENDKITIYTHFIDDDSSLQITVESQEPNKSSSSTTINVLEKNVPSTWDANLIFDENDNLDEFSITSGFHNENNLLYSSQQNGLFIEDTYLYSDKLVEVGDIVQINIDPDDSYYVVDEVVFEDDEYKITATTPDIDYYNIDEAFLVTRRAITGIITQDADENDWKEWFLPILKTRNRNLASRSSDYGKLLSKRKFRKGEKIIYSEEHSKNIQYMKYKNLFNTDSTAPTARAIFFKPDGLRFYISDSYNQNVVQYELSSAWDISSVTGDPVYFDYRPQDGSGSGSGSGDGTGGTDYAWGIYFSPDGLRLYLTGYSDNKLHQYSLEGEWDISTATYDEGVEVTSSDSSFAGVTFSEDGKNLYTSYNGSDTIHHFELSTAWNLSSATEKYSFDITYIDGYVRDLFLDKDGKYLYFTGSRKDKLYKLEMETAYDLSSRLTIEDTFFIGNNVDPYGVFFSSDGKFFYCNDLKNDVTLCFRSNIYFSSVGVGSYEVTGDDIEKVENVEFNMNHLSIRDYYSTDIDGGNTIRRILFDTYGTKAFIIDSSSNRIYSFNLKKPFFLEYKTLETYFELSLDADVEAYTFDFKPDGTKVFVGDNVGKVYGFPLSTAWDISTIGSVLKTFNPNETDGRLSGITFSEDGLTMLSCSYELETITESKLTSAWDLDTASKNADYSFSNLSGHIGITFSKNGNFVFVVETDTNTLNCLKLSTPWDISTASLVPSGSIALLKDTYPAGVTIANNSIFIGQRGLDSVLELYSLFNLDNETNDLWNLTIFPEDSFRTITSAIPDSNMKILGQHDSDNDHLKRQDLINLDNYEDKIAGGEVKQDFKYETTELAYPEREIQVEIITPARDVEINNIIIGMKYVS